MSTVVSKPLITAALLSVLLAACSTTPDYPAAPESSWRLKGKLGVSSPQGSESALLNWLDCGQRWQIRLLGPLGTTGALMEGGDKENVWLKVSGREPVTATSVDELAATLGWPMPVSGLRYWIQGLAEPNADITERETDTEGRLQQLQQRGWAIRFDRYGDADSQRPGRIRLQRGDLRATVLSRDWSSPARECGALLEAGPRL